ncbi:MAG: GNAT family N-acetyltransferase [Omnitrophica WOR_2 bacterium]
MEEPSQELEVPVTTTEGKQVPGAYRTMQAGDIKQVVLLHTQAFKEYFHTYLGPLFLHELYKGILEEPSGIAFVYPNGEQILGFVAGIGELKGFYKRLLKRHPLQFMISLIAPILKQPGIITRILRTLAGPAMAEGYESCGTLLYIAVLPESRSKGIGKILVQAFLEESARQGLKRVNLTTSRDGNDEVHAFYQRLNFTCARTLTNQDNRVMNEYVIELKTPN